MGGRMCGRPVAYLVLSCESGHGDHGILVHGERKRTRSTWSASRVRTEEPATSAQRACLNGSGRHLLWRFGRAVLALPTDGRYSVSPITCAARFVISSRKLFQHTEERT